MSTFPAVVHERWPTIANHRWLPWAYQLLFGAMALAVLWTLALRDRGWVRTLNLAIWAVFLIDYGVRLALARDRRQFLRWRLPETLAILPVDLLGLARVTRLVRTVRVLRGGAVLWRASRRLRALLVTNRLAHVLAIAVTVVLGGALTITAVEPSIGSYGDAVWWSIVTTTTVGYGDVVPATAGGRVVAVTLMVVGIGTMGMIAGTVATYVIASERHRADPGSQDLEFVRRKLDRWDELSPAERRATVALLERLCDPGS